MKVSITEAKSIITSSNLPDADFVINPYIGCQHACIYCYADFMKRFTGHSKEGWGDFVDVKVNSDKLINNQPLNNKTVLIGSVTDPYQPIEAKYKVTRKILHKLQPLDPKLEILTKSALVLRDLEYLKKFKNIKVGISLNSLDMEFSRMIEPFVASPKIRIQTLKKLHEAGIKTYLFISPIFPEITEYKEIVSETEKYVDEFLFENLNIRANNKRKILDFIKKYRPDLSTLYQSMCKYNDYWKNMEKEIRCYCNRNTLNYKVYFNHSVKK